MKISNYLTPREEIELLKGYSIAEFNSISYLTKLISVRKGYYTKMRSFGFTDTDIKKRLNRHFSHEDIWERLRRYRRQSIESGDYIPPIRKNTTKYPITQKDILKQRGKS